MKTKPRKRRSELAYIDYDGSKVSAGKNYKDYKRVARAKKKAFKNPCKHESVMVTHRCRGCWEVSVSIRKGMIK